MHMNHELTRLMGIKSKAPAFKNEDWGTREYGTIYCSETLPR
jgi:hypothetical protein